MRYKCYICHKTYPVATTIFGCDCSGFFVVEHRGKFPDQKIRDRKDTTIWRYREGFGLPDSAEPVSLGEGRTPLVKRQIDGKNVLFKMDFMQPTGSFKDRGASVLISVVKALGVSSVVEDSSGNAGAAIAAYSRAAGISCTVFVPDYTPEEKLIQIRLFGAKVVKVSRTGQDANSAAVEAAQSQFYASHLWDPFFPIEIQSSAFEIWEELDGKVPPFVVVPVVSGGLLEGFYMGFKLLLEAGYYKQIPKIIGVQAENCMPVHDAFKKGFEDFSDVEVKPTVAEGISVQKPPRARAVLKAIRDSGGRTVSVNDDEILQAMRILISMGIFVEPTLAATLAGWYKLSPLERDGAVVVLTGNGLKESKKLEKLLL